LRSGFAGAALEEDVVGDNDGGPAVYLQQGFDMLQEVKLLVGGGSPEVLPLVDKGFFAHRPFTVGNEPSLTNRRRKSGRSPLFRGMSLS